MATISTRAKSPTRTEAIAKALKPGPIYNTGVLLGKLLMLNTSTCYNKIAYVYIV